MQHVLVIDDSAMVRRMIGIRLKAAGYDVVTAVDGLDGLEKLAEGDPPLAVVCDVRMPRMDGFEFLETIQSKGLYAGPVVMLTSDGGPDRVARARALGAQGWLDKPVKLDRLLAMIAELVAARAS